MGFYECYSQYKNADTRRFFEHVSEYDVLRAIAKERVNVTDLLVLLSPKAENYLEEMAQRAQILTRQQFGKAILLFTPMYLANYCVNQCAYCSFNVVHGFPRKKLTLEEVEVEAQAIAQTGIRHILILTGESRVHSPVSYIKSCIKVLKKYFTSISIEVYPLEQGEYEELILAGVDGLTVFQEVYDEDMYDEVHISGPKKNYQFRLDAPERACKAHMRSVNIGALLGLSDWRREAFFTGLHAHYLQNKYTDTEISISLPRMRPNVGGYEPLSPVDDMGLVQIMLAMRLFMPRVGVTISTRESAELRDNLLPLGVTKMSADSTTAVGGHTQQNDDVQFEIADERNVEEIRKLLLAKGFQPVFKDWEKI